jgi:FAD/FMN-containing dehydrogenase
MSKIAEYLNEHILGEITSSKAIRERFSRDGSVLSIQPELVMFPRVTNDIRKAARFSWQLAEKGHVMPLTARGSGTDTTGGAIGKGLIIDTVSHLNNIIFIALKGRDHFVHVQPGVTFKALNDALNWQGMQVTSYPESGNATVGGAVAGNLGGQLSGKYGLTGDLVTRLEVVLANGDLIETSRLSKHDFNKKKGLQTLEGEIYRKIDGLIEDNQEAIDRITSGGRTDNTGYSGIAKVKNRDGSFDLTPLFVGSQGTLGIISEVVLKTDFISKDKTILVAVLPSVEAGRDVADILRTLDPESLEIYDGKFFESAKEKGKNYALFSSTDANGDIGSVLYVQFGDFSDRARARKLKKAVKTLAKYNASTITSNDHSIEELLAIRDVSSSVYVSESRGESWPPLFDGASVPSERIGEFTNAIFELAARNHVELPMRIRVLDGTIFTRPALHLDKITDRQKAFKLISEYSQLIDRIGGKFISEGSEGRIKASAAYALLDDDLTSLYDQIRTVFDPFGTLNPGVKQAADLKSLAGQLRTSYDIADLV